MAAGAVRVEGLRGLNRALRKAGSDLQKELVAALKDAGEPVRRRAERLAQSEIRNIGEGWHEMKVGTRTALVYVAPRRRRRGGSPRPVFGRLLMNEALIPALDQEEGEVIQRLDRMLDELGADFNH